MLKNRFKKPIEICSIKLQKILIDLFFHDFLIIYNSYNNFTPEYVMISVIYFLNYIFNVF